MAVAPSGPKPKLDAPTANQPNQPTTEPEKAPHRPVRGLLDHTNWKGPAPLLRAGPIRSDGQTDRHNPVLLPALRTVRQVRTGVLCIPFTGTQHGPTDRAAFGLVEAFRRGDGHGEDVVLELDSRRGLNLDLVRVRSCRQ